VALANFLVAILQLSYNTTSPSRTIIKPVTVTDPNERRITAGVGPVDLYEIPKDLRDRPGTPYCRKILQLFHGTIAPVIPLICLSMPFEGKVINAAH